MPRPEGIGCPWVARLIVYRYLVGADGEASRVRRWAGLERGSLRSERRLGFRRHYRIARGATWSRSTGATLGRLMSRRSAMAKYAWPPSPARRGLNFDLVLEGLPYLRGKLLGQAIAGRDRGAVTTTRRCAG